MTKKKKLQNNWLRNLIPDDFSDLDYLYAAVLYKGLIFFWTEDEGEEVLKYQWEHALQMRVENDTDMDWSTRYTEYKRVYDELKAAYDWAVGFDDRMNATYFSIAKEDEERKLDDIHLANIIKHRNKMWT